MSSNRLIAQGTFYAPLIVGEALKGAIFTSRIMEKMGFEVNPKYNEKRNDIVTAVMLGNKDALINFCKGIQKVGPVDSHVLPEPWAMPGYDHKVIMAGGSFIQGSSIELSADAPLREPYAVYIQGGLNLSHVKLGIMSGLQAMIDSK
jgi:cystathionine beta-lyase family protein involved in aluminum resistance